MTLRTYHVGPGGSQPYSSLASAWAAAQGDGADLVSLDDVVEIQAHAGDYTSDGGAVNTLPDRAGFFATGFTTDAAHPVRLRAAPGSGHDGSLFGGGGDYSGIAISRNTLSGTYGALVPQLAALEVEDLIVDHVFDTVHAIQYAVTTHTGNGRTTLRRCLLGCMGEATGGAVSNAGGLRTTHGAVSLQSVAVIMHGTGAPQSGFGIYHVANTAARSFYDNATIRHAWIGAYVYPGAAYDTATFRNVAAEDCQASFAGGLSDTIWDSCAADETPFPSVGGTVSNAIAGAVMAFDGADSALITAGATSLIDAGLSLVGDPDNGFSDDVIGTTRAQGAGWDIGAAELIAAGVALSRIVGPRAGVVAGGLVA